MQEAPGEGCLQRSRPRATAAGAQLPLGEGLPRPLGALRCPALAAHVRDFSQLKRRVTSRCYAEMKMFQPKHKLRLGPTQRGLV